jgi:hypothetical protein
MGRARRPFDFRSGQAVRSSDCSGALFLDFLYPGGTGFVSFVPSLNFKTTSAFAKATTRQAEVLILIGRAVLRIARGRLRSITPYLQFRVRPNSFRSLETTAPACR